MHEKEYRWTDEDRPLSNLEPAPANVLTEEEISRRDKIFLELQKPGNAPAISINLVPEVPEMKTMTFQQFILWCRYCETEFLARESTKVNPITWNHHEREEAFSVFFSVMWMGKGDCNHEGKIWHDFYMEKVLKDLVNPINKRAKVTFKEVLNSFYGLTKDFVPELTNDYGAPLIKERNGGYYD